MGGFFTKDSAEAARANSAALSELHRKATSKTRGADILEKSGRDDLAKKLRDEAAMFQAEAKALSEQTNPSRFSLSKTFTTLAGLTAVGLIADYHFNKGELKGTKGVLDAIKSIPSYLNLSRGNNYHGPIEKGLNPIFNPLAKGMDDLTSWISKSTGFRPEDVKFFLYPFATIATISLLENATGANGPMDRLGIILGTGFAMYQIGQRSGIGNDWEKSFMAKDFVTLERRHDLLPRMPDW